MADRVADEAGRGPSLDRRRLLIGLAMAAGAGVAFARQPSTPIDKLGAQKLDQLIPNTIGGWQFLSTSGLVVPTEDPLSDSLYSQLVTRVYTHADWPPIMLLVAQSAGQTGLLQVHRPEYCYPAGGFDLSPIVPKAIPVAGRTILVNELTATAPGRPEQIVYWTRVGDRMPLSWAEQRLAVATDNLRGYIPDAVLTRISTIDPDRDRALVRLASFAEALLGAMGSNRSVLIAA